jgi:hypothetical protein
MDNSFRDRMMGNIHSILFLPSEITDRLLKQRVGHGNGYCAIWRLLIVLFKPDFKEYSWDIKPV